jgi:hypothetical protein
MPLDSMDGNEMQGCTTSAGQPSGNNFNRSETLSQQGEVDPEFGTGV